jgi:hypothetical protein
MTADERKAELLLKRTRALAESDWLVIRHREEIEAGAKTTLTTEAYAGFQRWRQALRGITEIPGFPNIGLPPKPDLAAIALVSGIQPELSQRTSTERIDAMNQQVSDLQAHLKALS